MGSGAPQMGPPIDFNKDEKAEDEHTRMWIREAEERRKQHEEVDKFWTAFFITTLGAMALGIVILFVALMFHMHGASMVFRAVSFITLIVAMIGLIASYVKRWL